MYNARLAGPGSAARNDSLDTFWVLKTPEKKGSKKA